MKIKVTRDQNSRIHRVWVNVMGWLEGHLLWVSSGCVGVALTLAYMVGWGLGLTEDMILGIGLCFSLWVGINTTTFISSHNSEYVLDLLQSRYAKKIYVRNYFEYLGVSLIGLIGVVMGWSVVVLGAFIVGCVLTARFFFVLHRLHKIILDKHIDRMEQIKLDNAAKARKSVEEYFEKTNKGK